jgi:hypothetical protein
MEFGYVMRESPLVLQALLPTTVLISKDKHHRNYSEIHVPQVQQKLHPKRYKFIILNI